MSSMPLVQANPSPGVQVPIDGTGGAVESLVPTDGDWDKPKATAVDVASWLRNLDLER